MHNEYHSTITIDSREAEFIRHCMDVEPTSWDDCLYVDDSLYYGTTFPNGYSMELHCNGVDVFEDDPSLTNTAWGEAILFNEHGDETDDDISEGSAEFFSTWSLEGSDGNMYVVDIIVKEF